MNSTICKTPKFYLFLFVLFFACAITIVALPKNIAVATSSGDVYDMLNDEIVAIYEREIAKEPVVSNIKNKSLCSLAEKNGISLNKTKALILLADLSARVDDKKTFVELVKLSDLAILVFGKKCVDSYAKTLSESEQARLKELFLSAIKSKGN